MLPQLMTQLDISLSNMTEWTIAKHIINIMDAIVVQSTNTSIDILSK